MKPRKGKDIRDTLSNKGFIPVNGDHVYLFLMINGRKSAIRTKVSHGNIEYGDVLMGCIARQLHLSNKQLSSFLDCTISYDEYIKILKKKRIIEENITSSDIGSPGLMIGTNFEQASLIEYKKKN